MLHSVHHRDEFPQPFSMYEALRIRQLIANGLVAFFTWLNQPNKESK